MPLINLKIRCLRLKLQTFKSPTSLKVLILLTIKTSLWNWLKRHSNFLILKSVMKMLILIWKNIKIVWFLQRELKLSCGTITVNFILEDGKEKKTDLEKKQVMEFKLFLISIFTKVNSWTVKNTEQEPWRQLTETFMMANGLRV